MPVNTKYKNYSVKDFLKDDLFLQWQLLSTETLDNYWKQVLQKIHIKRLILPMLSERYIQ